MMAKAITPEKRPTKTKVYVTYNGKRKHFPYSESELVAELLKQVIEAFKIVQNAHLMSLFDADGNELKDEQTLAAAGVEAEDLLILRQSEVKGG